MCVKYTNRCLLPLSIRMSADKKKIIREGIEKKDTEGLWDNEISAWTVPETLYYVFVGLYFFSQQGVGVCK